MPFKSSKEQVPRKSKTAFLFGSKARTLELLADWDAQHFSLLSQTTILRSDWMRNRDACLYNVFKALGNSSLAVRSSAVDEDGWQESNAGRYLSLINIPADSAALREAVDRVFSSYADDHERDEVLIQPMAEDVAVAGVVLTRDLDTGGPYYVIGYDDASGNTDTVTSGAASHTMYLLRGQHASLHSNRFRGLINSVREIEAITCCEELDIEFCIDDKECIFILQVRPLAARKRWVPVKDESIFSIVAATYSDVKSRMVEDPGISGRTPIFGEMPDWNPAEMIGNAPRPLALSLYKHLITDRVWSRARADMGYRDVDRPLMISFNGRPYIDVRLSFNSFLPADIDAGFADHLVDFQLEKLRSNRELHDKVEFDIAVTCRAFDFESKRDELLDAGFARREIDTFESALTRLTQRALNSEERALDRLLKASLHLLARGTHSAPDSSLRLVKSLLDECKRIGTLPFSVLARHAFIAMSFLRSLKDAGILSEADLASFLLGIRTVASDFVSDMTKLTGGTLSRAQFLSRYGHLRPGTYDIMSERYDENPDAYLGQGGRQTSNEIAPFELSAAQKTEIQSLLDCVGYRFTPDKLLSYAIQAIKGREAAKFAFTKNISDVLMHLSAWGASNGLSREDVSFLPIDAILKDQSLGVLHARIEAAREQYTVTRAIHLPHLISEPDDVNVIRMPLGRATFITSEKIVGPAVCLGSGDVTDVDGKLLLIESADPGFDWIFSRNILGLITCYGGANSHMAIRCAEFGLPAAIGCGERLFLGLKHATQIELNCAERKIGAR